MSIRPKYKVVRVIERMKHQKAVIEKIMATEKQSKRKFGLLNSIQTLDYCIGLLRAEIR